VGLHGNLSDIADKHGGALYESYIHALTILSTSPSADVGAMVMMFGFDFSVIALIGIILAHRHCQEERNHDGGFRDRGAPSCSDTERVECACNLIG
jgi:hypothetical protein